jgi:Tol biopolymer transport system component
VQAATGRAMLAAALTFAAAAPTAEATFPGRNGRIAFTSIEYSAESNDDYRQIVSIRPDGSHLNRLVDFAGHPSYRPDGHMIAFAQTNGIFLMRSNGTARRPLLSGPYRDPDWAPDGKRLVVTRTRKPGSICIWSGRGKPHALADGYAPAWSPDGRLIAFERNDLPSPHGRILSSVNVIGSDGGSVHRLAPGQQPEWSPDGRRIIFTDNGSRLRTVRPDGTRLRRAAPIHARAAVYSPDGRRIAYMKGAFAFPMILKMRTDGRRRTRIFNVGRDLESDDVLDIDWQPRPRRAHR